MPQTLVLRHSFYAQGRIWKFAAMQHAARAGSRGRKLPCLIILFRNILSEIVSFQYSLDLFRRGHDVVQGTVMVGKIYDRSKEFAHIRFQKIGFVPDLRRQVREIGNDCLIEIAVFVSIIKSGKSLCEQAEGGTEEYPFGIHDL